MDLKKSSFRGSKQLQCLGLKKLLKIVNVVIIKETDETEWRSRWNRKVLTNIHLDHSYPLRNKWSPLCEEPPWGEEIYVEFGPWWTTCLGEGFDLLWKLDIEGSYPRKFYLSVCPWSCQLWPIRWSLHWAMFVLASQQCRMCPTMGESIVVIDPQ